MSPSDPSPSARNDLDDDALVAALRARPDLIARFPELLSVLVIPHGQGDVSSLLERQADRLRSENASLRAKLDEWHAVADQNSLLTARLFELSAALIPLRSRRTIARTLTEKLTHTFGADAVALCLPVPEHGKPPAGDGLHWLADDRLASLTRMLDTQPVLCGPLDDAHAESLFGERGAAVRSATLVALHSEQVEALLAIGSFDADRFDADSSTDYLQWLACIVTAALDAADD